MLPNKKARTEPIIEDADGPVDGSSPSSEQEIGHSQLSGAFRHAALQTSCLTCSGLHLTVEYAGMLNTGAHAA